MWGLMYRSRMRRAAMALSRDAKLRENGQDHLLRW